MTEARAERPWHEVGLDRRPAWRRVSPCAVEPALLRYDPSPIENARAAAGQD
ncbi:hypothetical protein OG883_28720 [Streptomyces sp. NBC_01142]|uniref:hypothetical protein n=1 Tax=Streptomyces sp. NBC_01142 TaxID=2975865 RepID=UPI00224CEF0E|nr:hypothetical protein [Streptomyces sp. NBC_01142]MCX4823787.1 hypothetical protein [Streptomyces sp. NBC_01142]